MTRGPPVFSDFVENQWSNTYSLERCKDFKDLRCGAPGWLRWLSAWPLISAQVMTSCSEHGACLRFSLCPSPQLMSAFSLKKQTNKQKQRKTNQKPDIMANWHVISIAWLFTVLTFYLPPPQIKEGRNPLPFLQTSPIHDMRKHRYIKAIGVPLVRTIYLICFCCHYSTSQGPMFTEIIPEVCLCWISADPRVQ